MKNVKAIIRPEKLDEVKEALKAAGIGGITVTEVEGHGSQGGVEQSWRGEKYQIDLLPKVQLDIVVPDSAADKVISTLLKAARTDSGIGDGKIFVYAIERAIKIRTGEEGEEIV
ncbi:MAG: P-II family nitrogen regulator [Clostridiales bacterium]|jgi:nitrogen regulatory protein P-II 1|nr:P-II family nitrogen regulator [Clostridiales bacterium]